MPPGDERDATPTAVSPRAAERGPSIIDLLRLSRSQGFSPGDELLYRQIAKLTGLSDNGGLSSLIDVPCGRGLVAEFFAQNYGIEAAGVDPDPIAVEAAEQRARSSGFSAQLHYQQSPVEDLPFKDSVFDLAIGELGIASSSAPLRAARELARVTRPGGTVVLIALIWTGHIEGDRRRILIQHLGASPLTLIEWKQTLREAGVVDLRLEDWSDQAFPFVVRGRTFTKWSEFSTLADKLAILVRAWRRWGWRGLKGALSREYEIRDLLGSERTIGVTLIVGQMGGASVAPQHDDE